MAKTVAILGGGVAGLSAAHELAERGFKVAVYERQFLAGGKARSVPVLPEIGEYPGKREQAQAVDLWQRSGSPGGHRLWIPGEHGFRFFPSFYRHIVDTMSRIPRKEGGNVSDNLVSTTQFLLARYERPGIVLPAGFPRDLRHINTALNAFLAVLAGETGVSAVDIAFFASRVWQVITSCYERRLGEYEKIAWWDFIDAEARSQVYQNFFSHGILKSLVAAQAKRGNARTLGDILIQLLLGILDPTIASTDRLLNGPTSKVWVFPWLEYLRSLGVDYRSGSTVTAIQCSGGMILGAVVQTHDGNTMEVTADYYLAALPIERIQPLITREMISAEPKLAGLKALAANVEWMNGIQFYLKRDVPIVHGHAIYTDSAWSLTSVSQAQFWPEINLADYGNGTVAGILSVDIADWESPGSNGKPAKKCTRDEIATEVWSQIKRSLNVGGRELLRDEDLHYSYLDPDIQESPDERELQNVEPLLVNYADTWRLRPEAVTAVPNLFLASDYVRTYTDLATMEGANEAARRAVNGILEACGSNASRCSIWNLHEPEILQPFREYDRARFNAGLPWDERMTKAVVAALDAVDQVGGNGLSDFGAAIPNSGPAPGGDAIMRIASQIMAVASRSTGAPGQMASISGPSRPGQAARLRIVQKK